MRRLRKPTATGSSGKSKGPEESSVVVLEVGTSVGQNPGGSVAVGETDTEKVSKHQPQLSPTKRETVSNAGRAISGRNTAHNVTANFSHHRKRSSSRNIIDLTKMDSSNATTASAAASGSGEVQHGFEANRRGPAVTAIIGSAPPVLGVEVYKHFEKTGKNELYGKRYIC